jgi:hypothetical protein
LRQLQGVEELRMGRGESLAVPPSFLRFASDTQEFEFTDGIRERQRAHIGGTGFEFVANCGRGYGVARCQGATQPSQLAGRVASK